MQHSDSFIYHLFTLKAVFLLKVICILQTVRIFAIFAYTCVISVLKICQISQNLPALKL